MKENPIPFKNPALAVNDDEMTPTILNPITGHILVTNIVGKRVLELCDGERTVEAIATGIADEFRGASPENIQADIRAFLELASAKGVIEWRVQSSS